MALGLGAFGILHATEVKNFGYWLAGISPPVASIGMIAKAGGAERATASSARTAELPVGHNGHFFTDAEINGRAVPVMIDTGASMIALTYEDAQAIGVAPSAKDFTHQVSTANGTARVAPILLDRVQIGNVMVRRVAAAVVERGKLQTTLLGNSFLSKLSRYEMRQGRLVLEE
jgi:aspartyl protease family protein